MQRKYSKTTITRQSDDLGIDYAIRCVLTVSLGCELKLKNNIEGYFQYRFEMTGNVEI